MSPRTLIALFALSIGIVLSWLLLTTTPEETETQTEKKIAMSTVDPVAPNPKSERKAAVSDRQPDFDPNAIPYERIIAFSNEKAYRDFLKKLANSKLRNLGQLDTLRAVRLGFDNLNDFNSLDLDPSQLEFNYPVTVPELGEIAAQEGLVGFGSTSVLEFLGITTDNSSWGEGVTIAVIDTGIEPHIALRENIRHINLIELGEGAEPNSHGTSVASLIAGTHPNLKGVAPISTLISVRVADENGSSSSFILAEGIIAASDAGAQLINISLGSPGNSSLIRQAIEYATDRGSVIFASSGNEGAASSAYPAANDNVYSVGAVDANGTHLNFSNTDSDLSFSAPGLQVPAAIYGEKVTSFTGTSGSAPLVVGAVAAVMSEGSLSAQAATQVLFDYTNEAGSPGADAQYGNGIIDVGRAVNRNTPGINDIAVASQNYLFPDAAAGDPGGLQVSVENRGTEPFYQSNLDIQIDGGSYSVAVQALQPNERRVITIPAGLGALQKNGQLEVMSTITPGNNTEDIKPSNNQRSEVIILPSDGS